MHNKYIKFVEEKQKSRRAMSVNIVIYKGIKNYPCLIAYEKVFQRSFSKKEDGVFLFLISFLVPEIFTIL